MPRSKASIPAFVAALEKAARQIREFHQREVEQSWFTTRADGTMLGVKVTPLAAAGIYVPGGRAQYPSTVLMNAIPAKVAGVKRVVMVTPPQKDGLISPYTLAAAKLGGVDEIYMVGGAQAVAALAYGTETIPRVDKITGPGNAFVAAAKQIVSGDVGIDMVAGPSEVCVLADATAKPMVVAADLMAQAEHDPLAACYLVTCDEQFAREVEAGVDILVAQSAACRDHARLARQRGHHRGGRRHGRRRRGGEHRGARAPGAALQGRDGPARRYPQRRRHLCGRLELRAARRLCCRPQPHAADRRHGHVLQPAFGRRVR